MLGFKTPLCWTMGRETLPLQIVQALLQTHTFSLCFFWFFCSFFFLFFFVCALVLVITLFACAPCNSLVTFCYSLSFCCPSSPCYSFHLVDICCSLNELFISRVVHHHLTIRHCLALFIINLCFSLLPCVAYNCFVVTITTLLLLSSPHYLSYQVLSLLLLITLLW